MLSSFVLLRGYQVSFVKQDCVSNIFISVFMKHQNREKKEYLRSSRIDSRFSVVNFDDYFLNSKLETITFQKST